MLEIRNLQTRYGASQVLFGMELAVGATEVVALLGRNGMGKTTTVHSLFGIVRPHAGEIRFEGRSLRGLKPHHIAQTGLGLVPEGRRVFPTLSVVENLVATARTAPKGAEKSTAWHLDRVFAMFPRLAERKRNLGSQLSGGEQQMLAIGRALMTNPRLLVLDEATEGLAPIIRKDIWACLAALKADGQSILVVDKNLDALTRLADRHVVVEKGQPVWSGDNHAFIADPSIRRRYLSV